MFKNPLPSQQPDAGASSESDEPLAKKPKKHNMWRYKKKFKLTKDDDQSTEDDENDNNDHGTSDNNEELREYSNDETNFPEVSLKVGKIPKPDEFVFANVDAQPKSEGEDPDKLFLISLLPHLKAVPEEARLNVKMDLMQVLRNASYGASSDQKIF